MTKNLYCLFFIIIGLGACKNTPKMTHGDTEPKESIANDKADLWSSANFYDVQATHLDLDLNVDFESKTLAGSATWTIDNKSNANKFIVDIDDLQIDSVILDDGTKTITKIGESQSFVGKPLIIDIKSTTKKLTIYYATIHSTMDSATALQWLEPSQTFGKKQPFLYSQNEPIMARTWIPCQDLPGVRITYNATIKVPEGLMALMSADNPHEKSKDGVYNFSMKQPIPSYLIALAVGDLTFRSEGENTGVYAEPAIIEKAANEMTELPQMVAEAEKLYGPYQWGRYDVLVLPLGFPIGGMENPKLTFATPTILAGDKSLMNLIAHELAHSWSGNLVTNASWNDLWLNEGFTVYFERRITEAMKGKDYADMLWTLGIEDLDKAVEDFGFTSPETKLKLDLKGQDPANSLSDIAYEKGALFLLVIEKTVGRDTFDQFLNQYFADNKFKPMTTEIFIDYLNKNLLDKNDDWKKKVNYKEWIYNPGIPDNAPKPDNKRFAKVDTAISQFAKEKNANKLATKDWSTFEWLYFLRNLKDPTVEQMEILDKKFNLTESKNNEIAAIWYEQSLKTKYEPAYPAIKDFLEVTGRGKFLEPLYKEMTHSVDGLSMANEIFNKSKNNYHPTVKATIGKIVNGQ